MITYAPNMPVSRRPTAAKDCCVSSPAARWMTASRRSSAGCCIDTKLILEDQLAPSQRDSRKHGTTGEDIDFALLVDGLEAEREQGITIDVAYRFFARRAARSSSPTRRDTSSTRATWPPAPPTPMPPSS